MSVYLKSKNINDKYNNNSAYTYYYEKYINFATDDEQYKYEKFRELNPSPFNRNIINIVKKIAARVEKTRKKHLIEEWSDHQLNNKQYIEMLIRYRV